MAGVGEHDAHPEAFFASGDPGRVAQASASGETTEPRLIHHGEHECRGCRMGDVADGGDNLVVLGGVGLVQDRAEFLPEEADGGQGLRVFGPGWREEANAAFKKVGRGVGGTGFFAAGHRVRADEGIGGGEMAGGEEDGGLNAAGIGHDGTRAQAGGDRQEGLGGGVDRGRHNHQVSTPDAGGRVVEDFGDTEIAEGGPGLFRARPAGERPG